jgi:spore coat protein CotH
MNRRLFGAGLAALAGFLLMSSGYSQPPGGGFGQPGGKGFGPPGGQERKILKDFDKNGDGWLNAEERAAARDTAKKGEMRKGGGGKGFGGNRPEGKPGPKVELADVKPSGDAKLYDPAVLRTIFLEFENKDWEQEMQDFHGTDVDVAATMMVDGKRYPNVGVHFRGMSSYMGVGMGSKRSLGVNMDMADSKQRLLGYKNLNLLNCNGDGSQLSTVLYSHIARQHIPAPKANVVKVVINGESWGLYTNVQQFDKTFLEENYRSAKGTRWKVRGSPGGRGGFEYFGDDPAAYKRVFEIKTDDDPKAWQALINVCKVLKETPADKLEAALTPIMDVDGLLWFLALDVALINSDGFWTRASDYSIFLDNKGKLHIVPHDMNEAFHPAMGPGGGGFTFRMPRPGEILPPPIVEGLRLTPEQRKTLEALQKEADEKLNKLLTPEQREELKRMQQGPPPGAFPGGPGGPPPGGAFPPPPMGGVTGFGQPPMGPRGGGGVDLDPLVGLNDASKPLRSKVLAVPALKAKYLANIKTIAEKHLDWKTLGPVVSQYRSLMEKEVELDTRKVVSTEEFKRATADEPVASGGRGIPLRTFADQRRKYLLNYTEAKK